MIARANIADVLRTKVKNALVVADLVRDMEDVTIEEREVVCCRMHQRIGRSPVLVQDSAPSSVEFHSKLPAMPLTMKPGVYETICKMHGEIKDDVMHNADATTLLKSANNAAIKAEQKKRRTHINIGIVSLPPHQAQRLLVRQGAHQIQRFFGTIFKREEAKAGGPAQTLNIVPPCIQRLATTAHMSNHSRMMMARYLQVYDEFTRAEIFSGLKSLSASSSVFKDTEREIGIQSAITLRDQSWTEVENALKNCIQKPSLSSVPCLAFMSPKSPDLNMCPYSGNVSSRVVACCTEMHKPAPTMDIEDVAPEKYWSPNRVTIYSRSFE
jgi:hypothetical protein